MKTHLIDTNAKREALQLCADNAKDELAEIADEMVRLQQSKKELESGLLQVAHESHQLECRRVEVLQSVGRFTGALQRMDEQ